MAGRKRVPLIGSGPRSNLAQRLRDLRDTSGMTLRQLAERSGYSTAALSAAESGRATPTWPVIEAFVQACRADPANWRQLWELARDEEVAAPAASVTDTTSDSAGPTNVAVTTTREYGAGAHPGLRSGTSGTRRGRRVLAVLLALVCVAVVVVLLVHRTGGRQAGHDPQAPSGSLVAAHATRDGRDPYEAGCRADAKQLDWQPVKWPGGRPYGTIILMYSPACRAAWGYLQGPVSHTWTTHIVAHRDPDRTSAPAQYTGDQKLPGSWGDVLSTVHGCVFVEAFITEHGTTGESARTSCFKPAG
ncbi:helix-turn-helix domain-containing protein [Streptomyces sp. MMS24-I2-30]|uniref:helix-turn-helix domain-containing protein n=1 Tax=Streptomyces sp. MMS24-I2-30 TaxID=3351564 RepID=UPI003896E489